MEQLSFKDALLLAAQLTIKESITLTPHNLLLSKDRIDKLIDVADLIQKKVNEHLAKQR